VSATIIVTGTDRDVGKTVFCAGLTAFLDGVYWKPIQSGLVEPTDTERARELSGLDDTRFIREAWSLRMPASPHWAAELDEVVIDPATLKLPVTERPLIVEGAGGLLVPITRQCLQIEVFARWAAPVVLCARTSLGTLNHTLLSIEALKNRAIPLLGVALIGNPHRDNERTLAGFGGVRILGRLPFLDPLTPESLAYAFARSFCRDHFLTSRAR
jgi:dethiobiotin synthetase